MMWQIHDWEAGPSFGGCRVLGGKELVGVEVAHHLLRDLGQDTLGQCFLGSIRELSERHEVHDISIGDLIREHRDPLSLSRNSWP